MQVRLGLLYSYAKHNNYWLLYVCSYLAQDHASSVWETEFAGWVLTSMANTNTPEYKQSHR